MTHSCLRAFKFSVRLRCCVIRQQRITRLRIVQHTGMATTSVARRCCVARTRLRMNAVADIRLLRLLVVCCRCCCCSDSQNIWIRPRASTAAIDGASQGSVMSESSVPTSTVPITAAASGGAATNSPSRMDSKLDDDTLVQVTDETLASIGSSVSVVRTPCAVCIVA